MKRALALMTGLALAGCVSFGPKAPKLLLTITSTAAVVVGAPRRATPESTISIVNPGTPAAITTTRIPVYEGATELAYVPNVAWNDSPSRLFGGLLSETISARTGKTVVGLRQNTIAPSMQLSGQLLRFGIDPAAMQAVVVFDGIVARAGTGTSLETRRFEARAPISAVEPREIGRALNQAANDAAAQVADWVKG